LPVAWIYNGKSTIMIQHYDPMEE